MTVVMGIGSAFFLLVVLGPMIIPDLSWPEAARDLLTNKGLEDTGANNLVSAIYLGYRAYDTIGETIVLLAAVTGALALIKGFSAPVNVFHGPSQNPKNRTNMLSMTTGKLAPVVMLFGWYVMFFGHQSPGGGFQGGVVLASGILFIALGREQRQKRSTLHKNGLHIVEFLSLVMILFLANIPLLFGASVLENPLTKFEGNLPKVIYIIGFNMAIGLKVGSGLTLLGILMMDMPHDD